MVTHTWGNFLIFYIGHTGMADIDLLLRSALLSLVELKIQYLLIKKFTIYLHRFCIQTLS